MRRLLLFDLFMLSLLMNFSKEEETINISTSTTTTTPTICTESNMFLNLPQETELTEAVNPSLLLDGWQIKNSRDFFLEPVTDNRWEDFGTNLTNFFLYNLTGSKSLSLSIFNIPNQIEFYMDDDESMEFIILKTNEESCKKWTHYNIFMNGGKVDFFMDNVLIRSVTYFVPKHLTIITQNLTYFKVHDYNFHFTTNQTKAEIIRVSGKCIILYTYLCPGCYLEAYIPSDFGQTNYTFSNSNNKWQEYKIKLNEKGLLYISQRKDDPTEDGFWGLDIRQCSLQGKEEYISSEDSTTTTDIGPISNKQIGGSKQTEVETPLVGGIPGMFVVFLAISLILFIVVFVYNKRSKKESSEPSTAKDLDEQQILV